MSGPAAQQGTANGPALLQAHPARFSDAEMQRRRTTLDDMLAEHALDQIVIYGAHRAGSAVGWLTG